MKQLRNEISFLVDQVRIWIASYQDELVQLEECSDRDTITDLVNNMKKQSYIEGKIDAYHKIEKELDYILYTTSEWYINNMKNK